MTGVMKVPFLDLKAQHEPMMEGFRAGFERVVGSSGFILGPEVEAFEKEYAEWCGAKYCVGVSNGLAAISIMMIAAGIKECDEVLVPSNTYIASVMGVEHANAVPILVEPNPRTHVITADACRKAITPKTKAILVVDLYGLLPDFDEINALCAEKGLLLFSDSAQSHGANYKGKRPGNTCMASSFSFYPGKNLGALGDAGGIVTNSKEVYDTAKIMRNYGSEKKYYNMMKGRNERLDPMQAAFLRVKIPYMDQYNARRHVIAGMYTAGLKGVSAVRTPEIVLGVTPVWHQYVIQLRSDQERSALMKFLDEKGIFTMIHYPIPPHLQEAYKDLGKVKGDLPICEELAETILSLPICPTLTDDQVNHVITRIVEFFAK